MRKIVVGVFAALDGVVENPMWTFPYWNDEIQEHQRNELFSSGALLLGRETYVGFAEAWPGREDEQGYADRINTLPKYVVSNTLDKAHWGDTTIIRGDEDAIAAQIAELKQGEGQDILIFGSGDLSNLLMERGLLDELRVLLYPLTVGSGGKLFNEGANFRFRLLESKPFTSGVVALRYALEAAGTSDPE
jgi:dihydrofolate reductase